MVVGQETSLGVRKELSLDVRQKPKIRKLDYVVGEAYGMCWADYSSVRCLDGSGY